MSNNPSTIEREINTIRIKLYNETKNLSIDERVKRANKIGKKVADKYGLKVVSKV